jgi:hypothetical protein
MGAVGGDEIRLYTQAVGGNPVSSSTGPHQYLLRAPLVSGSTTFYIEAVDKQTGCVSLRNGVSVEVHPNPGVPTASGVMRCGAGAVTVTGVMGNPGADELRLYTVSSGGGGGFERGGYALRVGESGIDD